MKHRFRWVRTSAMMAAALLCTVGCGVPRANPGGPCLGGLGPGPFLAMARRQLTKRTVMTLSSLNAVSPQALAQTVGPAVWAALHSSQGAAQGWTVATGLMTGQQDLVTVTRHPTSHQWQQWSLEFVPDAPQGADTPAVILQALSTTWVRPTLVTVKVLPNPSGFVTGPPGFSLAHFAADFPSQDRYCGAWQYHAWPQVVQNGIQAVDSEGVALQPGWWLGFSQNALVFAKSGVSLTTLTWYSSGSMRLPFISFVTSRRRTLAPIIRASTPLEHITTWDFIPVQAGLHGGWVVQGTDSKGRALVVWVTEPGRVMHLAYQYLNAGVSASQAVALARQHGLTVRSPAMVELVNPVHPEWWVPVQDTTGTVGWGDVLVDFRTGQLVGHSRSVIPRPS